ncbi:MAG TPA: DUF1707 domain-containing protein [Pseudonocardiaceae bacterium]|nr:DUF1707 domain-containing protein [Pseudonocardiaceae bacterium]
MNEHGEQVDPADLRVSHAEREHVLSLLQEALSRGMLDAAEFDERSGQALAARTRRDLNQLVVDLPVRASGISPVADSVVDSADAVELRGWFSSLKRRGDWVVPRKLVLRPRMGSVELDFTEARISHDVVDIELDLAGGSVELRLPDGASASMDRVEVIAGSAEDHRRNATHQGCPHFQLTGQVRWGSLEIRGPRRKLFGGR